MSDEKVGQKLAGAIVLQGLWKETTMGGVCEERMRKSKKKAYASSKRAKPGTEHCVTQQQSITPISSITTHIPNGFNQQQECVEGVGRRWGLEHKYTSTKHENEMSVENEEMRTHERNETSPANKHKSEYERGT